MRRRIFAAVLMFAFLGTLAGAAGLFALDCACAMKSACCTSGKSCPLKPKGPPKDGAFAACGDHDPVTARPRFLHRVVLVAREASAIAIVPDWELFARTAPSASLELADSHWRPPRSPLAAL